MPQNAIGDKRTQLFVVRIEQLVVDDFREHALLPRQTVELIELRQREHRRLLDQHMLARLERRQRQRLVQMRGQGDTDRLNCRVFQVTREKEIVWEYVSPFIGYNIGMEMTFLWHAFFYAPDFPGLQGKDLNPARFPIENQLYGPPSFVTDFKPILL